MVGINNSTTANYAPQQTIAQVQPIDNAQVMNEKQAVIQPKNESKIAGNGKPTENPQANKHGISERKEHKPSHISSASFAKVSVNVMSLQEV